MTYIHQCPECGRQYTTQEQVARVKCPYCGKETQVSYAQAEPQQQADAQHTTAGERMYAFGDRAATAFDNVFANGTSGKSRGVAGLLALLLGFIGLHYFYCGKTTGGVTFLVITILSCGILGTLVWLMSVIQGVLFFTMTQDEFEQKWIYSNNNFPLF